MTLARTSIVVLVACSTALMAFGCGKRLRTADTRSDDDPAAAAIEVDGELVSDATGIATYNWRLGNPNSQKMRASAQSSIAGAYALFPPAAFELDSEVRFEEGATIASQERLTALGIDKATKIVAAGPAVVISWTYDDETYVPYKLAVPAPKAVAMTQDAATPQSAVLFIRNVAQSDEFKLGILSGSKVTTEGDVVAVSVKNSGVYQAVHLSAAAPEEGEATSDTPIETIGPAGTPPETFQISGPAVEWSSAKPLVDWAAAKGANYFEVKIDADSKTCATPDQTYKPVYATELVVDAVKNGAHYVCVSAVNSVGSTPASNDGFSFQADKSAPAKPAKPTSNVSSLTVTFSWTAVDDAGPSGFSHYYVEIGTTPGGSDMFTGVVAEELEKSIIGFAGQTYFARVKAVDVAGNESAWSANSAGATVDSD